MTAERVSTVAAAAEFLGGYGGGPLCPVGTGTRTAWGAGEPAGARLDITGLNRVLRHDAGDFTAELEAGVSLARAQAAFAEAGQWLALDPPPAPGEGGDRSGTVGGLVGTADSGPARHRYGGVRDLLIGITVVLSDGSVAKAGGNVIKNVAGYDLGKLFTGSYGTLGLVATVTVRLHPLPVGTATATGGTDDPEALSAVATALARRPLEALSFDASWSGDHGTLSIRFAGVTAPEQAAAAAKLLDRLEGVRTVTDDAPLWTDLAARQRSAGGAVLHVTALPGDLPVVLRAARDAGGTAVSRAALGQSWLALPAGPDLAERVRKARAQLAPLPTTVLDGADRCLDPAPGDTGPAGAAGTGEAPPGGVPPGFPGGGASRGWPAPDPGARLVMERVKARFDPKRVFRPGAYVGGI